MKGSDDEGTHRLKYLHIGLWVFLPRVILYWYVQMQSNLWTVKVFKLWCCSLTLGSGWGFLDKADEIIEVRRLWKFKGIGPNAKRFVTVRAWSGQKGELLSSGEYVWTSLSSARTLCSAKPRGELIESKHRRKFCSCPQKDKDCLKVRLFTDRRVSYVIYHNIYHTYLLYIM